MSIQPFRIGLTGSIGMGKTTTAAIFAEMGIPVWDADAAVSRLYQSGGKGAEVIGKLAAEALQADGAVDRDKLRQAIAKDPELLPKIEEKIHPLVRRDRETFALENSADTLLFDIPLLFETGSADHFDLVIVVSAPEEIQKERVLARPGMTQARFRALVDRQMPDREKRVLADIVIDTGSGMESAREQVKQILEKIRAN